MIVPIRSVAEFRRREEADQALQDEAVERHRARERERDRQASLGLGTWALLSLVVAAAGAAWLLHALWPAVAAWLRALGTW